MHHSAMLLGRAEIAGVLESHPRVTGLKDHSKHLAPEILCFERFVQFDLAASGHLFIVLVALFKCGAIQVMKVGRIIWGKQRPFAVLKYPLHKQVRDPVCGIHVVGAAPVIARVLAQIEEFLDIHMPRFEICTHGPFAFAALIDGDGGVIHYL